MKALFIILTMLVASNPAMASHGKKGHVQCFDSRRGEFPYVVDIKNTLGKTTVMSLKRGKKTIYRTKGKVTKLKNRKYYAQISSGYDFNIALAKTPYGKGSEGYVRARFENRDGVNLVAGKLSCKNI